MSTNYKSIIENLRNSKNEHSEFAHLGTETYLDHAANGIYMTSLIRDYARKLTSSPSAQSQSWSLFSNPHSQSQSGSYTNICVELTRDKILNMFNTTQTEYDVVFVHNVSDGLKLLAENFNFQDKQIDSSLDTSSFVYLNDNHTSVIGMREIVTASNIYCAYENEVNGLEFKLVKASTNKNVNSTNNVQRNLFVYPAQSNFNGRKYDLNLIENVKNEPLFNNGEWFVCLDAASYACSSKLDLSNNNFDFVLVSFYKLFGFPTGVAAILIKKSDRVKASLKRNESNTGRYFGGGTVQMALVDQDYVSVKQNGYKYHEYLENGTISYLSIIGIALAIEKFESLLPNCNFKSLIILIESYLLSLTNECLNKMKNLTHFNNQKLVEIYRKHDSIMVHHGPIIAFNLKNSANLYIGYNLVDKLAQEKFIHLRTGCFCNLGACKMFLKNTNILTNFQVHGHKCGDHIDLIDGKPTGAIRISFGYCTIEKDVDLFVNFLTQCFVESSSSNISSTTEIFYKDQQQYSKITSMFLYPIKSCASMKIEKSWVIKNNQGLLYDRYWVIVDHNGVVLTQKRLPILIQLQPFIDLKRKLLLLSFKNNSFELKLSNNDEEKKKQNIVLANMTHQIGYDEGEDVALWLTKMFEIKETCRLIKRPLNGDSFVNKADYLLINEQSVVSLRKFLMESLNMSEDVNEKMLKTFDDFLAQQFRANIVVSCTTKFSEENWKRFEILNKNIQFKILDNCTRCQMININQNANTDIIFDEISQKFCSMLLKQLHKLKLNYIFGVYLKKVVNDKQIDEQNISNSLSNISSLVNNTMFEKKNFQISIGDIGISF